jgi:hypothetical protein
VRLTQLSHQASQDLFGASIERSVFGEKECAFYLTSLTIANSSPTSSVRSLWLVDATVATAASLQPIRSDR